MATTTSSTCKWLKEIIEYYKTKFKEDGHTTLTIKGHHSGWVTAGHHGNMVGDGHHIGWVTRGHHKGEGPGRTNFPSTNRGGSGRGNWVKNYHHGSGANVRDKGGPFIGGGPGSTNFPSTVHYGGGKIKGIQYADSTESWGKHWYHGGDRFGKNYHPSGGDSDKGKTGSVIGGGPRGIPVPTSTRHGGETGRGVNRESIKETTNKHSYYGGNTVGNNYYHTGGSSERGRSGPIISGGPEITHLPSTILFVGGTDSRGKKYHYSSGATDKGRNGTIIGGGPRDTHVTSTVLYRGERDRGEHHLLNDWGKIHHHSSRVSDRDRDGLIIGGGPKESRLPSTNRQDSTEWGRVTHYADVGKRVKNRYHSGGANYRSRDGPNIGSGPTRTTASDTSRGGHIIGGGPKRTHLPPTIYHRGGIGVMSDQQSSVNE
ncbi:unnamed protein product [Arctia plantaginis]|uniref:Uncharacterized protein n=1 Tax=Arctia plantaginis TaxID=874455 RepID=A0A8S0ZI28_ARCPL|nr:unnamed protein product [Arctia plantaginis]